MSRKQGRPPGAKNITTVTDFEPTRCKKCGSSRRSKYVGNRRQEYSGQGFTAIIYHRCTCLDCGQQRIDREKVYGADSCISGKDNANDIITSAESA